MNIKIPKEVSDELLRITLNTIEFGNINGEDTDLLHIVQPNFSMDYSAVDNNHTLFFKDEESNTDHLFITPRGFVNGIVTGSNTLFFEALCDGLLKDTCLEFLEEFIPDLITYKLLKAFIGCAERDFKQSKGHKNKSKKLKWSLEYTNIVLMGLGKGVIEQHLLDKDMIRYVRDELNTAYENKEINFSVPYDTFQEIMDTEDLICFSEVGLPFDLVKYYYNTWSENK